MRIDAARSGALENRGFGFISPLRAFRRAVLFCLFAWRVDGLLSLHLSVCSFVRGGFLRIFSELGGRFGSLGGLLGSILGALGVAWAPFWESGVLLGSILGALGIHFRGLDGPLGFILGALGVPWAPF